MASAYVGVCQSFFVDNHVKAFSKNFYSKYTSHKLISSKLCEVLLTYVVTVAVIDCGFEFLNLTHARTFNL